MSSLTKQTERITETAIVAETMVMRIDNGEFFALSGTAAAAWGLIDGKRDRAELIAALASQYAVDRARLETDVDEFLLQLKASGLLVEN